MNTQKFEEIEHLLEDYSMIPICKEIYADVITPISLLRKMEVFGKNFFLLESVEGGENIREGDIFQGVISRRFEAEYKGSFLNAYRVLETCPNTCGHHEKLIKNLLRISAQKNLMLSRRILHTSSKSIRGRLLAYFSDQAKLSGSYKFTIPFNRQQLADYLNVDRSAMSNELSKMKNDGIIEIDKNTFTLKEQL